MRQILKTIVGSHAHGTSTPQSDTDTRSIFVLPTKEIVGIGNYQKFISNSEEDNNSWEIAHFIYLTLRCNPTCLEVLLAKPEESTELGDELRSLFSAFLNRKHAYNAFKGFAIGQRKKYVSPTTNYFRKPKAAAHFLRVLYNGCELLETGSFTVKIADTQIGESVILAKKGGLLFEETLEIGDKLIERMDRAFIDSTLPLESNKYLINEFLIKIRRSYWD